MELHFIIGDHCLWFKFNDIRSVYSFLLRQGKDHLPEDTYIYLYKKGKKLGRFVFLGDNLGFYDYCKED